MTTQTLVQKIHKAGFVVIPRKEYEEFLDFKKAVPTFKPSKAELKAIARGEKEFIQGKFRPWSEFKDELERHNRKRRAKTA